MDARSIFVASHSREIAIEVARQLRAAGHHVTSRWLEVDTKFGDTTAEYSDAERRDLALLNETDVRAATGGVVLITEAGRRCVPGGKHVESGIALALGRPVYILGRRENIFHWHPRCICFDDIDGLLKSLNSLNESCSV